ncbi:hypothetical protein F5Y15DRAFT_62956 [Xylariaceae sp. FL0016]|nr:hypothetical protein F5Y15DRAFT_62956 [Xylariaceae sp. FL0016]
MGNDGAQFSSPTLLRLLKGVVRAQSVDAALAETISQWISEQGESTKGPVLGVGEWRKASQLQFQSQPDAHEVIDLVLGVAYLQNRSRSAATGDDQVDVGLAWSLIRGALDSKACHGKCYRGPQGFFAVHLCSLVLEEGKTDELYRLHVWLPGDIRASPNYRVHSHQAFAQSWILAGEGTNISYRTEPAEENTATHSEYRVIQNFEYSEDGKTRRRVSSTLHNSKEYVKASIIESNTHKRLMTYTMEAGTFHASEVEDGRLHATLFLFDSHRGWEQDAAVLGPVAGESHTNERFQESVKPKFLKQAVEDIAEWERTIAQAEKFTQTADWEDALERYDHALRLCKRSPVCRDTRTYESLTLGNLGATYRRFGRYDQTKRYLAMALDNLPESRERVWLLGEMGVAYRHDNLLLDAKAALQEQYEIAQRLSLTHETSRAIGNLGMVNFQLYKVSHDPILLEQAIAQCTKRVETARAIGNLTWELVGCSRLSLCYLACSEPDKALQIAMQGFEASKASHDPTAVAITRYFLGKALLHKGENEKALAQFNPIGVCTPAIAFCKEASEEHLEYLEELIANGADLDLIDEDGYKALDYAFFSGHVATQECIIRGLKAHLSADEVGTRVAQSRAREGYRVIFQEVLRPILRQGLHDTAFQQIRESYSQSLQKLKHWHEVFDEMRCIRYTDFRAAGQLPSFENQLASPLNLSPDNTLRRTPFIIFISYRWINTMQLSSASSKICPDDENNTQYKRMLAAIESLLAHDSSIDPASVRLWIDFACIDQNKPLPGIVALPLIIAQCNAMISLVDETYHTRAWCCLEVQLISTLMKSYGIHKWYEQVPMASKREEVQELEYSFRPGELTTPLPVAVAHLSKESDRPKLMFLERQIRFLR